MMPPRKPEDDPLAVENAEAFLWETISRILQRKAFAVGFTFDDQTGEVLRS